MAELSKVVRTEDAIILQRERSNSRSFERYAEVTERLAVSYRQTLEADAQLIRSEKLAKSGELISTEEALVEASRRERSQIVYFTQLQEKVGKSREQLFGGFDE